MPRTLRRHRLAFLTAAGWSGVLRGALAPEIAAALRRWAGRGLPLVVTRQAAGASFDEVSLGWPAPLTFGRQRLAFSVAPDGIARFGEFPPAAAAIDAVPAASRASVIAVLRRLDALGTAPRAYGSHGWQRLSGLPYVHPQSDLDLWLTVRDLAQADAAVAALQAADAGALRVDGELVGPDDHAVAWPEYQAWRAGRSRALLVKRLQGVALADRLAWPLGAAAVVCA